MTRVRTRRDLRKRDTLYMLTMTRCSRCVLQTYETWSDDEPEVKLEVTSGDDDDDAEQESGAERTLTCEQEDCGRSFRNKHELVRHQYEENHLFLICWICCKTFEKTHVLRRHIAMTHALPPLTSATRGGGSSSSGSSTRSNNRTRGNSSSNTGTLVLVRTRSGTHLATASLATTSTVSNNQTTPASTTSTYSNSNRPEYREVFCARATDPPGYTCAICFSHFRERRYCRDHFTNVHKRKICRVCGDIESGSYDELIDHVKRAHANDTYVFELMQRRESDGKKIVK